MPADTDKDGMPDEWEKAHYLNPNLADHNTPNAEGYTALEVYLGSLMGEQLATSFPEGISEITLSQSTLKWNKECASLSVDASAIGCHLAIYSAAGGYLMSLPVDTTQISLASLPTGAYLIQLHGTGITPRVLKCIK